MLFTLESYDNPDRHYCKRDRRLKIVRKGPMGIRGDFFDVHSEYGSYEGSLWNEKEVVSNSVKHGFRTYRAGKREKSCESTEI